jgi:hypothetical protein
MKYQTMSHTFEADSAASLVEQMHSASYATAEDDATFMQETAERTQTQNGAPIRFDTPEHFVADLIAAGLIKELGE